MEEVNFDDFESGFGFWNDGGNDCRISSQDSDYAYSGNLCVRLRDNTNSSLISTNSIDLSGYDILRISFTYITESMDGEDEDFWFQISPNGGGYYVTYDVWSLGEDFENGIREFDTLSIQGPFSWNSKLRFRCDASSNSDWVFIDDVLIEGCGIGATIQDETPLIAELRKGEKEDNFEQDNVSLYPNPSTNKIYLDIDNMNLDQSYSLRVFSSTGVLISDMPALSWEGSPKEIDLNHLQEGIYLMQILVDDKQYVKKFMKR